MSLNLNIDFLLHLEKIKCTYLFFQMKIHEKLNEIEANDFGDLVSKFRFFFYLFQNHLLII